jgi:hypothetical protein
MARRSVQFDEARHEYPVGFVERAEKVRVSMFRVEEKKN